MIGGIFFFAGLQGVPQLASRQRIGGTDMNHEKD